MTKTFTDQDMRDQVAEMVGGDVDDFDVIAIMERLQDRYGTVDIDTIESAAFWAVVERCAL